MTWFSVNKQAIRFAEQKFEENEDARYPARMRKETSDLDKLAAAHLEKLTQQFVESVASGTAGKSAKDKISMNKVYLSFLASFSE